MLELFRESGWAAWASLFLTIGGLAAVLTIGRRRGRPGSTAGAFAAAVLASGALGVGTGQHMVDKYVMNLPETDLKGRVDAVSIGTREASSNLILSGLCAMLVLAVGAGLALVGARKEGPA